MLVYTCFFRSCCSVDHVLIVGLGVGGQKVKVHVRRVDVVCVGSWFVYGIGPSCRQNTTLAQGHTP